MAKGTKKYQRIPDKYLEFIKFLEDQEVKVFTLKETQQWMSFSDHDTHEMLQNLTRKGMLDRLEKGKYCRYGFRNDKVIGTFISGNGTVAYWSALNLHGMTEQIPNVVFIQLPQYRKPQVIFNVRYKFINVLERKVFGIIPAGYGNESFPITDKEKTILDCFDIPVYSGGYDTLIRAFVETELNPDKLLEYGRRIGNLSVLKRLAFLSELFSLRGYRKFRKEISAMLNNRYSLIDSMGPVEGEFISKWKIRLNISRDQLQRMI